MNAPITDAMASGGSGITLAGKGKRDMKDILTTESGIGKGLFDYLTAKLDLPEDMIALDLHLETNEPITYTVTAYAHENEDEELK